MQLRIKLKEDGEGPYRWGWLMRTGSEFSFGSIYRQHGDDLSEAEVADFKDKFSVYYDIEVMDNKPQDQLEPQSG